MNTMKRTTMKQTSMKYTAKHASTLKTQEYTMRTRLTPREKLSLIFLSILCAIVFGSKIFESKTEVSTGASPAQTPETQPESEEAPALAAQSKKKNSPSSHASLKMYASKSASLSSPSHSTAHPLSPPISGLDYEMVSVSEKLIAGGAQETVSIIKTHLKYPLLRVVDVIKNGKLTSRTVMAADHFIVKLKPGQSRSDLESLLQNMESKLNQELKLVREFPLSRNYLVGIEAEQIGNFATILDTLKGESQLEYSEPDIVAQSQ